jgi:hypothetical protein
MRTHTYTNTHMGAQTHTLTHTHTHGRANTHTHTLTHTQVVCGKGAAKAFGTAAPDAGGPGAKPWCESFEEGALGQVCALV